MNGGAYGAGKAASGQAFDFVGLLMRPHVTVRILCWTFSVVVFACIATEGSTSDGQCQYDGDDTACNIGNFIGVIGFLASSALFAIDVTFDSLSSVKLRRRAVLADLAFSGVWAFVCFIGACYVANAWRKSPMPYDGYGLNNLRAAVVFLFFCIPAWAGSSYLASLRFKDGMDASQFMSTYDASDQQQAGAVSYDAYGQGGDFGPPPFSQDSQMQNPGMVQQTNPFQAPSY